ncbi:hypothetical protein [Mucilaginibacter conchicola]|nr:hypothetical protein [Mucilaginibacter conchicola]
MNSDDFLQTELAGINEVFERLEVMLSEYVVNAPGDREEAEELRRSFSDLRGLYQKGKRVWFDQYRLLFRNKIMRPSLNGIRGYIAIDLDRIYKRLSLSEKLIVSNLSNDRYRFLVYNDREPERLLRSIADCVAAFCKSLYRDKGRTDQIFNDRKDALLFSLPLISEEKLFRLSVTDNILQYDILCQGIDLINFDLHYQALSCIVQAAEYKPV